jgi:hypothetical protein
MKHYFGRYRARVYINPNRVLRHLRFTLVVCNRDEGRYIMYADTAYGMWAQHWLLTKTSVKKVIARKLLKTKEMEHFYRPKKFLTPSA